MTKGSFVSKRLFRSFALSVSLLSVFVYPISANALSSWDEYNCTPLANKMAAASVASGSDFDIVILGGTPSAAAAAKSAAAMGKKVLVISESSFFGGAIANGLTATDVGAQAASVGLAGYYLDQLADFYHNDLMRAEPKVAECLFEGWLNSPNISVDTHSTAISAVVSNRMIQSLTYIKNNDDTQPITVTGDEFIDASYAGDLMALTGTRNRLGMADFYSYDEKITKTRSFKVLFRLKDPEAKKQAEIDFANLPHVSIASNLRDYSTKILDGMPSFTYRLCVTRNESNKIPFSKAPGYETYAPAWRTFMNNYKGFDVQAETEINEFGSILTRLWRIAKLPNDKYDLNAGAVSFTNLVMPRAYFENPEQRPAILTQFRDYLMSFYYFIQHDPSVPDLERDGLAGFGLCEDEFTETAGWPEQPYLREGRRLVGKTTVTARDLVINRSKPDGVAVGSYQMDSKPTLFVYANGDFARDLSTMYAMPIYEIPFRSMIPAAGPKNLIVSIGISASPQAFSSIRMEPQYIQLGQVAGIAASLADEGNHEFSYSLAKPVKTKLAAIGGFRSLTDICKNIRPGLRTKWGFSRFRCQLASFNLKPYGK